MSDYGGLSFLFPQRSDSGGVAYTDDISAERLGQTLVVVEGVSVAVESISPDIPNIPGKTFGPVGLVLDVGAASADSDGFTADEFSEIVLVTTATSLVSFGGYLMGAAAGPIFVAGVTTALVVDYLYEPLSDEDQRIGSRQVAEQNGLAAAEGNLPGGNEEVGRGLLSMQDRFPESNRELVGKYDRTYPENTSAIEPDAISNNVAAAGLSRAYLDSQLASGSETAQADLARLLARAESGVTVNPADIARATMSAYWYWQDAPLRRVAFEDPFQNEPSTPSRPSDDFRNQMMGGYEERGRGLIGQQQQGASGRGSQSSDDDDGASNAERWQEIRDRNQAENSNTNITVLGGNQEAGRGITTSSYVTSGGSTPTGSTGSSGPAGAPASVTVSGATGGSSNENHYEQVVSGNVRGGLPVVLDIEGGGIKVTDLTKSTIYMDAGGNGLQHRTAWAAAGNGVLYFDTDDSNTISDSREYIFTEWDPSAADDMDALRSKFDTNGDGKLTADEFDQGELGRFKVMVTQEDGSLVSQTLDQLGITEIDLHADTTNIELPDGSMITGQSTFVINGVTRTAANLTLVAEAQGHRVVEIVTLSGSDRIVTQTGYNAAGAVAFEVTSATNSGGSRITNSWDDDGDGVVDRLQTINTYDSATPGDTVEVITNYRGSDVGSRIKLNSTETRSNADGSEITIERDGTGGGWNNQIETRNFLDANGDLSITVTNLSEDGTEISKTNSVVTNNSLTRTDFVYLDGDSSWESRTLTTIVVQTENRRIDTKSYDAGNDLTSHVREYASLDGQTRTFYRDLDGTGGWDLKEIHTNVVDADGNSTTTVRIDNDDGSKRSETIHETSEDGLTKTTTVRLDGDDDGNLETLSSTLETVVIGLDSERTTNIHMTYADGSTGLRSRTILDGDQVGLAVFRDLDLGGGTGFSATDLVRSVTIGTNGDRVDEIWDRNGDGSVRSHTVETTSEDGLEQESQRDLDGDGDWDRQVEDVTTHLSGGSSRREIETRDANGILLDETIVTRSSNGLITTTTVNEDGSGFDEGRTVVTQSKLGNGTRVETERFAGNLTDVLSRTVTIESADRLVRTTTSDNDADGFVDRVVESIVAANGSTTTTSSVLHKGPGIDPVVTSRTVVETSADGLDVTATTYLNADEEGETGNTWESRTSTSQTFESDGDVTTTSLTENADGSRRSYSETTVSNEGRTTRTSSDIDGDGASSNQDFDSIEVSTTTLEADGDTVVNTTILSGDASRLGRVWSITSGDGLDGSLLEDRDGEGGYDLRTDRRTDIAANGDSTLTETFSEVGGPDRQETVTTTAGNGRSTIVETDIFADGSIDKRRTNTLDLDGTRTIVSETLDGEGNAQSRQVTETNSNGLQTVVSTDADGDGNFDRIVTEEMTYESDGTVSVETVERGNDGAFIRSSDINTSYDGRHSTEIQNLDDDAQNERTIVVYGDLDATGVLRERQTVFAEDGSTISLSRREVSADGREELTASDSNGTGTEDRVTVRTTADTGVVEAVTEFRTESGGLLARSVTTTASDGLSATTDLDIDGNGRVDRTTSEYTSFNGDGSVVETVSVANDRGLSLGASTTTTSANGLRVRNELDIDGDGYHERVSIAETTLDADGSTGTRQFTSDLSGDTLFEQTRVASGNRLESAVSTDFDGDGSLDRVTEFSETAVGAVSETIREFAPGGQLQSSWTRSVTADGRTEAILADWDGDGREDYGSSMFIEPDRDITSSYQDYAIDGMIQTELTARMSANGFQADYHFDFDADGVYDISREETRSFDVSGGTVRVLTERYGQVVLTYQETEIVSADGLTSITLYDMDGDGQNDGTTTSLTEYLADGGMQESMRIEYADDGLRYSSVTQTSADGRRVETLTDYDGNGVADQRSVRETGADGATTQYVNTYNEGGYDLGYSITETSADGLLTVVTRNGQTETTERSVIDAASYTWNNGVTGTASDEAVTATHTVDAFGVDTWSLTVETDASETFEVRLDGTAKARVFADAARLYDTLLDRDMTTEEQEKLVQHIEDGRLNELSLAETILKDDEIANRYGEDIEGTSGVTVGSFGFEKEETGSAVDPDKEITKSAFIHQVYMNALGRPPSLEELTGHLEDAQSATGSTAFAAMIVELSNSTEHRVVGNTHLATNNFDTLLNPVQFERQLDRDTVEDSIKRLVDVAYDRDATDSEIAYFSEQLLGGKTRPSDIVAELLSIDGSIAGQESKGLNDLAGDTLIIQAFRNGLSRDPSAQELQVWTDLIANGLSVNDFVASIALSADHRSVGLDHLANDVATSTGPGVGDVVTGDTLVGSNGTSDSLSGGEGDDFIRGEGGADLLRGNDGSDTYEWSKGDGNDTISDATVGGLQQGLSRSEADTLKLIDVDSTDVRLERSLADRAGLEVVIISTGERIMVVDQFLDTYNQLDGQGVERIEFADGVTWQLSDILANTSLLGTSGGNNLQGGLYDDRLEGRGGKDNLYGGSGSDTLVGGTGQDTLYGGDGGDLYVWSPGDSGETSTTQDIIFDDSDSGENFDVLLLKGVASSASADEYVRVWQNNGNLFIDVTIPGQVVGQINVNNFFTDGKFGVDRIRFEDGEEWNREEILSRAVKGETNDGVGRTLIGTEVQDNIVAHGGADTLRGEEGDDRLVGGTGSDRLYGGDGNDLYEWSVGDGNDRIWDQSDTAGEIDTLRLRGIEQSDLIISKSSDDLLVKVGTTGPTIRIEDRFQSLTSGVENLVFDDGVVVELLSDPSAVTTVTGTGANNTLAGTDFRDELIGNGGADSLFGGLSDDTLWGGLGSDTLDGGTGDDSYHWTYGAGVDQITENDTAEGYDTLYIHGISPDLVEFRRASGSTDLRIVVDGSTDAVILKGMYGADGDGNQRTVIDRIVFDDETYLTLGEVLDQTRTFATSGNDTLFGSNFDDYFVAGNGADTIYGNDGNDILVGQRGNDTLFGGNGSDAIHWQIGDGNDTVDERGAREDDSDTLKLLDVSSDDVSLRRVLNSDGSISTHLRINIISSGERINVLGQFGGGTNDSQGIEFIEFADTVVWGLEEIWDNTRIFGTNSHDTLTGTQFADYFLAKDGNDTINGGAGDDTYEGGEGNDVFRDSSGSDTYTWQVSRGNDIVDDQENDATQIDTLKISGANLSDLTFERHNGTNLRIESTVSNDYVTVLNQFRNEAEGTELTSLGIERIELPNGIFLDRDAIADLTNTYGGSGADIMHGRFGTDRLHGQGGNDILNGDNGDDWLFGGAGADTLNGDEGVDIVSYKHAGTGVTVDLDLTIQQGVGGAEQVGDRITGVEGIEGSLHADVLFGDEASNDLYGLWEADVIYGRDGSDHIYGGLASDRVYGGVGSDTLDGGAGADSLYGGIGHDVFVVDDSGDLTYDNGDQGATDTVMASVSYALGSSGSAFNIERLMTVDGQSIQAIDLTGNSHAQTIIGNRGDNVLDAGSGSAADTLVGGEGNDTYRVRSSQDEIMEEAGHGTDRVIAFVDYTLGQGASVELFETSAAAGTTSRSLTGNDFAQTIVGNAGINVLNGAGGNDTLVGNEGSDILNGGSGSDVFQYNSIADSPDTNLERDLIQDFETGVDRIDLSAIDANLALAGHQAFEFVGIGGHTATGSIRIVYGAQDTFLNISNDGDTLAEMSIKLAGQRTVLESDIIGTLNTVPEPTDETPGGSQSSQYTPDQYDNIITAQSADPETITGAIDERTWLVGNEGKDNIYGGDLDDYIIAGSGSDWNLFGNGGADVFQAGHGDEIVMIKDWEDGVDRVRLVNGLTVDDLYIHTSGSRVSAWAYDENGLADLRIYFTDTTLDQITAEDFIVEGEEGSTNPPSGGTSGNPRYNVSTYDKTWFSTTTERDIIVGTDGDNWWFDGGEGDDRITGKDGDDYIIAGSDNDWGVRGGTGADIFQAGSNDDAIMIWDWEDGVDKIRLVDGLQYTSAEYYRYGDYDQARFDTNGDGSYDTRVYLRNVDAGTLDASDFIF